MNVLSWVIGMFSGRRAAKPPPPSTTKDAATEPATPGIRLIHSDGSERTRHGPPPLGHLARSKGDFSAYGRSQQATNLERLGDTALRAGETARAAELFFEATRLWPVHANTQKAAEAYLEAGNLDMALRLAENQLERCRRENGHQAEVTADAHCHLARVHLARGDLTEAEISARAAIRIDRNTRSVGKDARTRHAAMLDAVLKAGKP